MLKILLKSWQEFSSQHNHWCCFNLPTGKWRVPVWCAPSGLRDSWITNKGPLGGGTVVCCELYHLSSSHTDVAWLGDWILQSQLWMGISVLVLKSPRLVFSGSGAIQISNYNYMSIYANNTTCLMYSCKYCLATSSENYRSHNLTWGINRYFAEILRCSRSGHTTHTLWKTLLSRQ